jgi:hypothetical protein
VPPASDLIKKAAKIESGSKVPHKEKVGSLTQAQLEANCEAEDARPQRKRCRSRETDYCRYRPLDGCNGSGVIWQSHGKKYRAAAEKVNPDKEYSLLDAMKIAEGI